MSVAILPETRTPVETDFKVRPFGMVGFKAYFSQTVFFRSDVRVAATDRVDHVTWRFGIGKDF